MNRSTTFVSQRGKPGEASVNTFQTTGNDSIVSPSKVLEQGLECDFGPLRDRFG
jgi:hypothetical protein